MRGGGGGGGWSRRGRCWGLEREEGVGYEPGIGWKAMYIITGCFSTKE